MRLRHGLRQVLLVVLSVLATLLTIYVWPYRSPLPAVELAPKGPFNPNAYKQSYEFNSSDWFTDNIPIWEKALAAFKGKPDIHYLEVGVYEGRASIWMLENILTHPTARVTAVDFFEKDNEELKQRCLRNFERSGAKEKVTLIVGYSQNELRKLPRKSFDIIYIDASHASWDVLEDAVLCWRLLKHGGLLIFDDYRWNRPLPIERQPRDGIDAFYRFYGQNFEVIHNGYQAIFRKRPDAVDFD